MTVAINNFLANATGTGAGTTVTYSYTSGSGTNRFMLLGTESSYDASGGATAATFNGVAMTAQTTVGTTPCLKTFSLVAPATGAHNIVITAPSFELIFSDVIDADSVNQTTPINGSAVTATGNSSTPSSGSVTCPSGGAVMGFCYTDYTPGSTPNTATGGTTIAGSIKFSSEGIAGGYRLSTGSLDWSNPNGASPWQAIGYAINAAASPADVSGTNVFDDITSSGALSGGSPSTITGTNLFADITGSGFLSSGASIVSGTNLFDDITGSGNLASSLGTVTTQVFKNDAGTPLPTITIDHVVVLRASDRTLLVSLTGQVTNSSGLLTITNGALVPGTTVMVVCWNNAATSFGNEPAVVS